VGGGERPTRRSTGSPPPAAKTRPRLAARSTLLRPGRQAAATRATPSWRPIAARTAGRTWRATSGHLPSAPGEWASSDARSSTRPSPCSPPDTWSAKRDAAPTGPSRRSSPTATGSRTSSSAARGCATQRPPASAGACWTLALTGAVHRTRQRQADQQRRRAGFATP
jgi:hypothetical protein